MFRCFLAGMSSSVTKYRLSAASLVTAIPAAYLAYVLVMTFLQEPGFNNLSGFFQIISGGTLALVTLMVLMPVGILIFGTKPEKAPKAEKKSEEPDDIGEKAEAADEEESLGEADEFEDEEFGDEEFEDDDDFK
jgi:hypothetical protein